MLFTSSFDPSAETNSTTVVNLFQTLCCVGESFFHPMSLLGVSFNSHITIRYHCMTWMETAKRFQVSALYHQPRKKQRLAAYPHLCDVRFMSVYVFAFLRTTRERTFFFHSSLCVRGRYGLVETCRLPLNFDASRLLISLGPIYRPMRGASPHLITFLSGLHAKPHPSAFGISAKPHPLFITQHTFRKNIWAALTHPVERRCLVASDLIVQRRIVF